MDHLTTIYNLPPWLCMKRKFIMLSLLIFSLSCNDIGAYLRPLIDDLQVLFKTGLKHMIYIEKRILLYVHCYMDYQWLPYSRYTIWIPLQHIQRLCSVLEKYSFCWTSSLKKQSYVSHRRYISMHSDIKRRV